MVRSGNSLIVLLTATLLLPSSCTRSADHYLENGKRLASQGKFDEALLNFRKALQKNSRMVAAYGGMADVYQKMNRGREAYEALRQGVESVPDNVEIRVKFADFCVASYLSDANRPQFLYEQVQRVSRQLLEREPNSFDGHRLQGFLGIVDRKPEEALEHLRKANEIRPGDPTVGHALTQVLFQLNRPSEAETVALSVLEKEKDFGPIYDVLYQYYENSERVKDAEELLQRKVANNPKEVSFALQLAAHYERTRNQGAVRSTLQRLLDNPRDFPSAHLQVGDFYMAIGQQDQAKKYYEDGILSNRDEKMGCQKRLAQLLAAGQKRDEALKHLNAFLAVVPDDVDAQVLRAQLWLRSPSSEDHNQAEEQLRVMVGRHPKEAQLRQEFAMALLTTKKADQAGQQLIETLKLKPDALEARFSLAEVELGRRDFDAALAQTNEILSRSPGNSRGRLLRATAMMGSGQPSAAQQELEALIRQAPDYTDADIQLGRLYLYQTKLEAAEALFKKCHARNARDLRAIRGLADTYLAQNQPRKALDLWRQEMAKAPDATVSRLALAAAAVDARQFDAALEQYQYLLAKDPTSSSLCFQLAQVYRFKGNNEAAIAFAKKAVDLDQRNTDPIRFLGVLLEASGHPLEAIAAYRQLLNREPNDLVALNNAAFLLVGTDGNLDEALGLAQRAQQLSPDRSNTADTVGWIYLKKNMATSAIEIFRNLVKKDPERSTFRYHLAAALLALGDRTGAKAELENALRRSPSKQEEQEIRSLLAKIG